MEDEEKRLDTLVKRRSVVQMFLLELYKRRNARDSRNYQILLGAGFGLWRSVFLMRSEPRTPHGVRQAATAVLERLIADNAFGYAQESANHEWTSFFYLNDAFYRLDVMYRRYDPVSAFKRDVADHVKYHLTGDGEGTNPPLADPWQTAMDAAQELLHLVYPPDAAD